MLDIKKMLARVEKLKKEIASMEKEVAAEKKRTDKMSAKNVKKIGALDAKLSAMPLDQRDSAKAVKLRTRIDALRGREDCFDGCDIGSDRDYLDESAHGAITTIASALDEMVTGKGKKQTGHLVEYEKTIAEYDAK